MDRITGLRPNPNLRQPYYVDNSQMSTYHGWQNSLRKRFSHNLSFDLNYTWSKSISNAGGDTGAYYDGENSVRNQSFFDLKADRGPSISDITHYFSGAWVYQLPASDRQSAIVRHMLWVDGRQPECSERKPGSRSASPKVPLRLSQRADYVGGNAVLPNYRETLQYLNPAAFQRIPVSSASGAPIRPGNAGFGVARAPGNVEC